MRNKKDKLQYYISDFACEVGFNADKQRYNKSWDKLWCRISKLGLFENDTKNKRSK